jgi:hypothetical protein
MITTPITIGQTNRNRVPGRTPEVRSDTLAGADEKVGTNVVP